MPGVGGRKILDYWWQIIRSRQLFSEVNSDVMEFWAFLKAYIWVVEKCPYQIFFITQRNKIKYKKRKKKGDCGGKIEKNVLFKFRIISKKEGNGKKISSFMVIYKTVVLNLHLISNLR